MSVCTVGADSAQHQREEQERRAAASAEAEQEEQERERLALEAARKLTLIDGTYEGDIVAGKPHGKGLRIWTSGPMEGWAYYGERKNNKMEGRGKMTYASGNIYDGEWKDDKMDGRGKMTYASGTVYDREWKDGKQQGISLTAVEAEEQQARREKNAAKKAAKKARDRARKDDVKI